MLGVPLHWPTSHSQGKQSQEGPGAQNRSRSFICPLCVRSLINTTFAEKTYVPLQGSLWCSGQRGDTFPILSCFTRALSRLCALRFLPACPLHRVGPGFLLWALLSRKPAVRQLSNCYQMQKSTRAWWRCHVIFYTYDIVYYGTKSKLGCGFGLSL